MNIKVQISMIINEVEIKDLHQSFSVQTRKHTTPFCLPERHHYGHGNQMMHRSVAVSLQTGCMDENDGPQTASKVKDAQNSQGPKSVHCFHQQECNQKCREETAIVKPVGKSNTQFIVWYLQEQTGIKTYKNSAAHSILVSASLTCFILCGYHQRFL